MGLTAAVLIAAYPAMPPAGAADELATPIGEPLDSPGTPQPEVPMAPIDPSPTEVLPTTIPLANAPSLAASAGCASGGAIEGQLSIVASGDGLDLTAIGLIFEGASTALPVSTSEKLPARLPEGSSVITWSATIGGPVAELSLLVRFDGLTGEPIANSGAGGSAGWYGVPVGNESPACPAATEDAVANATPSERVSTPVPTANPAPPTPAAGKGTEDETPAVDPAPTTAPSRRPAEAKTTATPVPKPETIGIAVAEGPKESGTVVSEPDRTTIGSPDGEMPTVDTAVAAAAGVPEEAAPTALVVSSWRDSTSVIPGEVIALHYVIANPSNAPVRAEIEVVSTRADWPAEIVDSSATIGTTTVTIAPRERAEVLVLLHVPMSARLADAVTVKLQVTPIDEATAPPN